MRGALFFVVALEACGRAQGSSAPEASGDRGSVTSASGATQHVPEASGAAQGGYPAGGAPASVAGAGAGGMGGAESARPVEPAKNYAVTGSWPHRPVTFETKPGQLKYTKLQLDDRFLAESCAIGDYNRDGLPDVSSGRRWYEQQQGPTRFVAHVFRDGHEELPRTGSGAEMETGVSDDRADYALDVDRDGYTDIVNLSNTDLYDIKNPSPAPAPQPHATAYWYQNPGDGVASMTTHWKSYEMHRDMRGEQHGLGDIDGDGFPEIYGACKTCAPRQTRGYYQADADPQKAWAYHAVTGMVTFPFGGLGKLHGAGFGDVNGDGQLDLLERDGAWLDVSSSTPNSLVCPADGCGWLRQSFYAGSGPSPTDSTGSWGGSHMFATDLDGDGDADVVSADEAHHDGLSWYEQTLPGTFARHRIMGGPNELASFGVYFSQLHALEVADMDGDGVSDIITGKTYLAQALGYGDSDPQGKPVVYVFRTVREPRLDGSPVSFEPILIDEESGVGYQIAVGHLDRDGILDLCIASKLGLYVFLGQ